MISFEKIFRLAKHLSGLSNLLDYYGYHYNDELIYKDIENNTNQSDFWITTFHSETSNKISFMLQHYFGTDIYKNFSGNSKNFDYFCNYFYSN